MADVPDRFKVDFTGETLLGTYLVSEKLAEGGMGSIYLAENTNLGRRVAVKVPHPRFLGEPGFRERFAREINELVRLEHPHVVRILARGEQDQIPFFVLQFLGGGSLEDRMKATSETKMAPPEVVTWLRPMAETLDFVHRQGIVHRDVKPANILFDDQGHVFLSDFGVAKVLTGENVNLTGTGTGIGSPLYLAPEQGMGKDVSAAADQYSLATAVYHALTGELPFAPTGGLAALVQKTNEEPRPISEFLPDLPAGAAAVIMRALSRDPAERFTTCAVFAEEFEAAVRPVPAVEERPPERKGKSALIGILGVLAGVLLVVAAVLLLGHGDAPSGGQPGESGEVGAGPRVFLIDPGSEPRRKLRYAAQQGPLGTYESSSAVKGSVTIDGQAMPSPGMVPIQYLYEMEILEVGRGGRMVSRWTLPGSALGLKSEGDEQRLVTMTCPIDARGRGGEVVVGDPEQFPEGFRNLLDDVGTNLYHYLTVLPDEEVGVGARWEVTDQISQFQMRMSGTTTYEILAIEGDRIVLHSAIALTAPAQTMGLPGGSSGQEMALKSFHSNGEGEVELDLRRPFPDRYEMSVALDVKAELEGKDQTRVMEMKYTADTTVHRK